MKYRLVIQLPLFSGYAIDPNDVVIKKFETVNDISSPKLSPEFMQYMDDGGAWTHRFGVSKASRWLEISTDSADIAVMLRLKYEKPYNETHIIWL